MIKIGDRVRVEYSGKDLAEYPYAKKLQGKEYIVSDVVSMNVDDGTRVQLLHYYTLHDAESEHGIPYCFTKDQLVRYAG